MQSESEIDRARNRQGKATVAERARKPLTLVLVVAATIFGMVLAGGFDLTPSGFAQESGETMVKVTPVAGLPSFADLAEAVSPAVVSIQAVKIERAPRGRGADPFEFFFGPRRRQPPPQNEDGQRPPGRRADSSGSGFVISPDGLIVTNHHVIEDAEELVVALNGRQYPAEVQGDDPATDIALLQIEPEEISESRINIVGC